ncbi:MAG: hypothetical protein HY875_03315 [Chloroflexi bacterium]|nr:hypothetical protein [Chloroflexota bacterium]
MPNDRPGDDDFLYDRLQEATSGDAAVRQLRRRYNTLREDYERLLDRLGELEERVAPATAAAAPPSAATSLTDSIYAPLTRLRDEYVAALASMQGIVSGLESLSHGAFKGQRRGTPEPRPAETASSPPPEAPNARTVQVDVKGRGFGALLEFQERLASLPGVARVAIHAIDNERASLIVELSP